MLFGDMTEGSYNFLGGSEVDVCSKSHQFALFISTHEGEKWACVLEHSTLFMSVLTMAFIIFSVFIHSKSNKNIFFLFL
jgi:hypothetical protein